jgi:hypothetical protein
MNFATLVRPRMGARAARTAPPPSEVDTASEPRSCSRADSSPCWAAARNARSSRPARLSWLALSVRSRCAGAHASRSGERCSRSCRALRQSGGGNIQKPPGAHRQPALLAAISPAIEERRVQELLRVLLQVSGRRRYRPAPEAMVRCMSHAGNARTERC